MTETIYEGDGTPPLEFELLNKNGNPRNLSGLDIRWALAVLSRQDIKVQKSTTDGGIEIVDADAGRFDVLLQPEDTRGLGGATWYHEVEVTDASGDISTVFDGSLEIKQTVINSTNG